MEKNTHSGWFDKIIAVACVVGLINFGYRLVSRPAKWEGFYETTYDARIYRSREFETASECSNWLTTERDAEKVNNTGRVNFECGQKCKPPTTLNGPYVCDKTFDN